LCEIGHKIDKIFENSAILLELARKKIQQKKTLSFAQNQQRNKRTVSKADG
jgi:hypothetical protein